MTVALNQTVALHVIVSQMLSCPIGPWAYISARLVKAKKVAQVKRKEKRILVVIGGSR